MQPQRVQRIYHISDIHVRLHDRQVEYEAVRFRLVEYIRTEASPSAIIVVTGDIMHTKNKLSPESLSFVCKMLRSLADLHPTFVIAGNHDMLLNHIDCLDSITPIIDALAHSSIFYCKYTGVTTFQNVHLAVSSLLDSGFCAAKDIPVQSDDEFKIALYHGMVGTIRTSRGTSLSGEYKVADFDGFDAVLLGDIHKHMYLNDQKTMAYASSLCSQNFSETDDEHGVLVWDLHYETPKRVSSFYHPIVNEYAHREYRVEDSHPWLSGDEAHAPRLPRNGRVRVEDHTTNRTDFLRVLSMLQRRLHSCTFVEACIRPHAARTHLTDDAVILPYAALVPMRDLCAEYLAPHSESSESPFVRKTVDLLCTATEQQVRIGTTWTVELMCFTNLMGYGGDCRHVLDFTSLSEPIVGIFAPNSSGKSSLFDIISCLLFGRMIRTNKVQESLWNILHSAADVGEGELFVRVGASIYRVHKLFTRDKKERSRVKATVDTVHELVPVDDSPRESEHGVILYNGRRYELKSRLDDIHGEKSSFATLIGTYEQFTFSNVYIPNKTKSFAREMTQKERKDMLTHLLCIPSIPAHSQSLQSDLTTMNRRLKSKRTKNEQMTKDYNDDAKLDLDLQLDQRTHALLTASERFQSQQAALEQIRHQCEKRTRLRILRSDHAAISYQCASISKEIHALESTLSSDSLEVLAERKRSHESERTKNMKTLQGLIEGLLTSILAELPTTDSVALDTTMTSDDVQALFEETTRIRRLEMALVEQYTDADKTNRSQYKERVRDAVRQLDADCKILAAMSHDYPLQRTLIASLNELREQTQSSSSDIVERKRIHDENRTNRRREIQLVLNSRNSDLRVLVECSFLNEPFLSIDALESLCASYDDETRALMLQKNEERNYIQQYSELMQSTRRVYKDAHKRISESLAVQTATLNEMARRDDGIASEDGLHRLQEEHHALLDKCTEKIETGKWILAQHAQLLDDYVVYAHDEHDRDELQRRRDAFIGFAFNPDCTQCQENPTRMELLRIADRLQQIDARKEPRDLAKLRKDESEQRIPAITEQIQKACGLHEVETSGWDARHSAYLSKLQDVQRLENKRRLCNEIEQSLRKTVDDWKQSDAQACYKRYKRATLTHRATTEKLARIVDIHAQTAAFIKNEQATCHNATVHDTIAALEAQLCEPDDDAIDREFDQHFARQCQLESIATEHERVVSNNTRHQIQQEKCTQQQHELDERRRVWKISESKKRHSDQKRAQATHTDTTHKWHRLEEQCELHRINTHNASVQVQNTHVQDQIRDFRKSLREWSTMEYTEYDENVAIRSKVHPKREELARMDTKRDWLESELSQFGASHEDAEISEADVECMQIHCNTEQATRDALHDECSSLRSNLATFIAQRSKISQRNATIHALEQDVRAVELSIDMLSERGVVACWFERALTMIQSAVNLFASPLLGRSLSFTCVGDKINIGFTSDGKDVPIPIFGGMESVVVDLAIQMALAELTRSVRCDLFIIDEAFFVMDQHNRMQVPRLLHELHQKYHRVFVISHDSFIHDVIHQEIQITTHDKIKKIQIMGACV
jgi:hypothetical protein